MDKLRELLQKAGVSDELIDDITEEFTNLSKTIRERHNKELANRIQRAKQVCLEEVSREKASLARKVKVFLESKARSFEEAAARQRKIDESESAAKVRRAVEVLTDGTHAVSEDVGRVAADRKLISRLEKALTSVREERDDALARAKRAFELAENAIQRNRVFESKLREVSEGKKELPDFIKKKQAEKAGKSDKEEENKSEVANESVDAEKVRLSKLRTAKAKSRVAQPVLKENMAKPKAAESKAADPEINRIAGLIPDYE